MTAAAAAAIGHNSGDTAMTIQVKLFNSLTKFSGPQGPQFEMELPVGTTVGELIDKLRLPHKEVFLVLVNGRDITPGLVGDQVRGGYEIEPGDTVAFTGPVPYSFGYGAPVV